MDLSDESQSQDGNNSDCSNIVEYNQLENLIQGSELVKITKELNRWKFKAFQLEKQLELQKKTTENLEIKQSRGSTAQTYSSIRSKTPGANFRALQSNQVFEKFNQIQQQLTEINQNLERELFTLEQNQIHKNKIKEQNLVIKRRIDDATLLINRAGRQYSALKQFGFMSQKNALISKFEFNDLMKSIEIKSSRQKKRFTEKLKEFQTMQLSIIKRKSVQELSELNEQKKMFSKLQKKQQIIKEEKEAKQLENEQNQQNQTAEFYQTRFSKIMQIIQKEEDINEIDPDLIIKKHEEINFASCSLEARYEDLSKEVLVYKVQIEQLKKEVQFLRNEAELFQNINPQEYMEKNASTFNQTRIKMQHKIES